MRLLLLIIFLVVVWNPIMTLVIGIDACLLHDFWPDRFDKPYDYECRDETIARLDAARNQTKLNSK